jgi:Domain of unknown function (DUF1707)
MEEWKMPDHGPRDRNLRAADADRDAVAETLRAQHLAGRLDTDELQERIERCYAAKSYADLDALTADLPGPEATDGARTRSRRAPRMTFIPLLPLLIVALAFSHGRAVWLLVPLAFFWFVVRPLRWGGPVLGGCGTRYRGSL